MVLNTLNITCQGAQAASAGGMYLINCMCFVPKVKNSAQGSILLIKLEFLLQFSL